MAIHPPPPAKLQRLIEYLDGLDARASIERVKELLQSADVSIEDLREFVRYDPTHYQRNLVAQNTWYEILVICWRSGQRSPIHNHAQSTCGLKVLSGICTETVFDHSPCGQVVALSSTHWNEGYTTASQDLDTHQVSNLQAPGTDLVTLHIYSPPLRAMKRFSIMGSTSDEWRPLVFDFSQGAGI